MFPKSLITTTITAGLVGLALSAQPAAARSVQTEGTAMQRSVHYADLDLSTGAGQARLETRLRHAASAVCQSNYGPHPLSEAMEARRCYREALQSARRTVASLAMPKMAAR